MHIMCTWQVLGAPLKALRRFERHLGLPCGRYKLSGAHTLSTPGIAEGAQSWAPQEEREGGRGLEGGAAPAPGVAAEAALATQVQRHALCAAVWFACTHVHGRTPTSRLAHRPQVDGALRVRLQRFFTPFNRRLRKRTGVGTWRY